MKWRATIAVVALLATMSSSALGRGGGGCLERGSLVLTPAGLVAVDKLRPGDCVLSVCDGAIVPAEVQAAIEVAPDAYWEIAAGGHVLRLTAEHPVATSPGVFCIASSLRPGDHVLIGDQNRITPRVIDSIRQLPATKHAYNLLVSPGGTYLAGGFVVHNKGCFLPETLSCC